MQTTSGKGRVRAAGGECSFAGERPDPSAPESEKWQRVAWAQPAHAPRVVFRPARSPRTSIRDLRTGRVKIRQGARRQIAGVASTVSGEPDPWRRHQRRHRLRRDRDRAASHVLPHELNATGSWCERRRERTESLEGGGAGAEPAGGSQALPLDVRDAGHDPSVTDPLPLQSRRVDRDHDAGHPQSHEASGCVRCVERRERRLDRDGARAQRRHERLEAGPS